MSRFTYKGWCNTSKVKANGQAPLYVRIRQGRSTGRAVPLNKHIEPAFFDHEEGLVKKEHRLAGHINRIIENKIREIEDIIYDYERKNRPLSIDLLKDLVSGSANELFIPYAKARLEKEKKVKDLSQDTINDYIYCLDNVEAYHPGLKIGDINEEWLSNLKYKLLQVDGRKPGGAAHEFRTIRKFFKIAIKEGLADTNPFLNFKIPADDSDMGYLELDELKKLTSLYFKAVERAKENRKYKELPKDYLNERQATTLYWYLISCNTSLRMKDVRELGHELMKNPDLFRQIVLKGSLSVKTSKSRYKKKTTLPITHIEKLLLNPPSRALKQSKSGTNKDLREALAIAGIDKYLTFHSSRHTFGVVGKILGMDTHVIKDIMAHSSISTTEIYAKIVDELKRSQMDLWKKMAG